MPLTIQTLHDDDEIVEQGWWDSRAEGAATTNRHQHDSTIHDSMIVPDSTIVFGGRWVIIWNSLRRRPELDHAFDGHNEEGEC